MAEDNTKRKRNSSRLLLRRGLRGGFRALLDKETRQAAKKYFQERRQAANAAARKARFERERLESRAAELQAEIERWRTAVREHNYDKLNLTRHLPIQIYLSDGTGHTPGRVRNAVETVLKTLDASIVDEEPPVVGSWWQKLRAKFKEPATQAVLDETAEKLKKAAELKVLEGQQAAVDLQRAQAMSMAIAALEKEDSGALLFGATLVVKTTDANGKTNIAGMVLNTSQLIAMEKDATIVASPATAFERLRQAQQATPAEIESYVIEGQIGPLERELAEVNEQLKASAPPTRSAQKRALAAEAKEVVAKGKPSTT